MCKQCIVGYSLSWPIIAFSNLVDYSVPRSVVSVLFSLSAPAEVFVFYQQAAGYIPPRKINKLQYICSVLMEVGRQISETITIEKFLQLKTIISRSQLL